MPTELLLGVPMQPCELLTEAVFDVSRRLAEIQPLDYEMALAVCDTAVDNSRNTDLVRRLEFSKSLGLCLEHRQRGLRPALAEYVFQYLLRSATRSA
jgi:hypothetical protein